MVVGAPLSIAALTELSKAWAPFRTWASVLLRSPDHSC